MFNIIKLVAFDRLAAMKLRDAAYQKGLADGARQELIEILRLISDAIEADDCESRNAMARAIYYRVEARLAEWDGDSSNK